MKPDVLIVGAGPAGLCAANMAAQAGADVLVLERSDTCGGQLIKQTHMFFGGARQYASYRGITIAQILHDAAASHKNTSILTGAFVLGIYEDGTVCAEIDGIVRTYRPRTVIFACGAQEKTLPVPGADLPGVYGAGAVQTIMNQFGIMPGRRVVMLGAGNIGLIVSYQLLQAGVEVLAVLDAGSRIGGYLVHASKLRRMGVPILTRHTVKSVSASPLRPREISDITVWQLDDNWQGLEHTQFTYNADVLGVAIGLSPLTELMWQAGCKMRYIPALGGHVPYRGANFETTRPGFFVAGDAGGVEEASSAMVTGALAGAFAARHLGLDVCEDTIADLRRELDGLRLGEAGERIAQGVKAADRGLLQD